MLIEGWMVSAAVTILAWAVAWGEMRAQVKASRERHAEIQIIQDQRHEESQSRLTEIHSDVRKINGQVREHSVKIENMHHEMERIRGAR